MVVGVRRAGLSISEAANLLGNRPFLGFTREWSILVHSVTGNAIVTNQVGKRTNNVL